MACSEALCQDHDYDRHDTTSSFQHWTFFTFFFLSFAGGWRIRYTAGQAAGAVRFDRLQPQMRCWLPANSLFTSGTRLRISMLLESRSTGSGIAGHSVQFYQHLSGWRYLVNNTSLWHLCPDSDIFRRKGFGNTAYTYADENNIYWLLVTSGQAMNGGGERETRCLVAGSKSFVLSHTDRRLLGYSVTLFIIQSDILQQLMRCDCQLCLFCMYVFMGSLVVFK